MDWKELLGFVGGALTTGGYVPQVWRLFRLKSAREISLTFSLLFVSGVALWLAYGIAYGLPSVIIWNALSLCLGCALLCAKVRYGR